MGYLEIIPNNSVSPPPPHTHTVACDFLTLNNGNVTYSNDSRFEGTMAFYDCFPGYTLTGSQTRSCVGVISGGSLSVEWTNNQSSCIGKYSETLEMLSVSQ